MSTTQSSTDATDMNQEQYEAAREFFFKNFRKQVRNDYNGDKSNESISRWLDSIDPEGEIGIETKADGSSRAKLIIDQELDVDFKYVHIV